MTQEELDAIRARCAAATTGPWRFSGIGYRAAEVVKERQVKGGIETDFIADCYGSIDTGGKNKGVDATFIAHARQDIPVLLDALEEANELIYAYQYIYCFSNEGEAVKSIITERDECRRESQGIKLRVKEYLAERDCWKERALAYEAQAEMSDNEFDDSEIPQAILDLFEDKKELARWVKRGEWHCKRVDEYARKIVPELEARCAALERALKTKALTPCRYCVNLQETGYADCEKINECLDVGFDYKCWQFDEVRFTETKEATTHLTSSSS